ncbi:CHRNN [Mytilus edulis]|uniref:CHRNN n=1 Tax=Mytilus edulis TaxID=6550 RepID=A0A8S3TRB3_MYTED|nr:CHRNN [Mytilus edulis]
MRWNESHYNNLKVLRIPASKLWLPDIVLYNNADDYTNGFMPINAMVHHDGWVFWSPPVRLRSSCKVDITFFPFDRQICKLKFGSWSYPKRQVDLVSLTDTVELHTYTTNGEWILIENKIVRNEIKYPIGDDLYPDVTVEFLIRRRILYYILNIIFPCFWLNVLSVLTFCLPPDAGEKITLSITVLLSYSVFMLLVAESMPPTSEFVPLIGIYLTMSMALASVAVILTVLVMKLHHCSPQQKRVPKWVRIIVLGILAKIVRCNCITGIKSFQREVQIKKQKASLRHQIEDRDFETSTKLFTDIDTKQVVHGSNETLSDHELSDHTPITGNGLDYFSDVRKSVNLSEPGSSSEPKDTILHKTTSEILKYMKYLVSKSDDNDVEEDIVSEWKQVALVVDRLLFWTFLLITIFSTLIILVFVPLSAYTEFSGL